MMDAPIFTTIPKPADRGDWLRARAPFFNASDAACLYNASPWKSLADVVVEKQTDPINTPSTEAMDTGNELEPFLLKRFGDKHGIEIITPDVLYVFGRLMATLDGVPVGDSDMWLEAKYTRYHWDEVPEHVRYQVIAQAAATGRRLCHVVAFTDGRFREWEIEPTDDEVGDLLNRVEKFWDHLDLGMVPDGAEFTAEHIVKLHPEHTPGAYVEVDDDQFSLIVEWEQLRAARVDAEKAEKEAKDRVAALIAEHEGALYGDRPIVTFKANKSTVRCDYKALEAEHAELVESYKRSFPGPRVLRFVGGD